MAGNDYPRIVTPRGVFIYPRFDEPDTKYVKPHGEYHTRFALDLDSDEFREFEAKLDEILTAYWDEAKKELKPAVLKKASKQDYYELEEDDEGEPTGRALFKFKLAAFVETEKKSWAQKPLIFDAGDPEAGVPPQRIEGPCGARTGTEGKANLEVFPYFMQKDKCYGLSLRLKGAQILKLVSGGGASADEMGFGAEGGYKSEGTDSGFAASKPSKSKAAPAADDEEEEF